MLNIFLLVLSWVMLIVSIWGFANLLYNEQWCRAAISSVLTGVSMYMIIFL